MANIILSQSMYFKGYISRERNLIINQDEDRLLIEEFDNPARWWMALLNGDLSKRAGKKIPKANKKGIPYVYRIYIAGSDSKTGYTSFHTLFPKKIDPHKEELTKELDNKRQVLTKKNLEYWRHQDDLYNQI